MSIKLNSTSGGSVSLDPVSSLASDIALTLPDSVGSANQLLKNGSTAGQLEYGLTLPSGNGSAGQYLRNTGTPGTLEFGDLPATSITRADMPAGSIIQVVQDGVVQSPTSTSISANTVTNISGMDATITPTSTSSKILVKVSWTGEFNTTNYNSAFGIRRGTTIVGQPTSVGNKRAGIAPYMYGYYSNDNASTIDRVYYEYLDVNVNTTSPVTYYATWNNDTTGTLYTGRTVNDIDNASYERLSSYITLMEVAG